LVLCVQFSIRARATARVGIDAIGNERVPDYSGAFQAGAALPGAGR
jgi:hypothetical protein